MALYLSYYRAGHEILEVQELHVGEAFTCRTRGINIWEDVTEIQADGHELEWIRRNFANLPCSHFRVCNWYGDHAKLIAAGLFYLDKN